MRKDRTKLIVAFRSFANAPKNMPVSMQTLKNHIYHSQGTKITKVLRLCLEDMLMQRKVSDV
jgi:hypothetical protein